MSTIRSQVIEAILKECKIPEETVMCRSFLYGIDDLLNRSAGRHVHAPGLIVSCINMQVAEYQDFRDDVVRNRPITFKRVMEIADTIAAAAVTAVTPLAPV